MCVNEQQAMANMRDLDLAGAWVEDETKVNGGDAIARHDHAGDVDDLMGIVGIHACGAQRLSGSIFS
jgi:hypothetical protein